MTTSTTHNNADTLKAAATSSANSKKPNTSVSSPSASSPSSSSPLQQQRSVFIFTCFIVFIRTQFYIASTFSGTRPISNRVPHVFTTTTPATSPIWKQCQAIIATNLNDMGDAGRIWLRHAYVGTNSVGEQDLEKDEEKYRCKCQSPQLYSGVNGKPKVTAIVQSFNHHYNIANISQSLKAAQSIDEIIICEDGSTDGSLHDWHSVLPDLNHFIIRSNNLHELRSYNRAMRISAGDIILLLQDDDKLPQSDEWIQTAQRLFNTIPNLGILGGYIGQTWDYNSNNKGYEFGEQISTHGGLRLGNTTKIPYTHSKTGTTFMYSECTWIAPMFIRSGLLKKVNGLDLNIAKRGEPGVWQDCILSYEAWMNGFTVGTFHVPFERGIGGHGSASTPLKVKLRERVYDRAVGHANRQFPRRRIKQLVNSLNKQTLSPRQFN